MLQGVVAASDEHVREVKSGRLAMVKVQGYLAHKKQPPPLGPPYDPTCNPTVGS